MIAERRGVKARSTVKYSILIISHKNKSTIDNITQRAAKESDDVVVVDSGFTFSLNSRSNDVSIYIKKHYAQKPISFSIQNQINFGLEKCKYDRVLLLYGNETFDFDVGTIPTDKSFYAMPIFSRDKFVAYDYRVLDRGVKYNCGFAKVAPTLDYKQYPYVYIYKSLVNNAHCLNGFQIDTTNITSHQKYGKNRIDNRPTKEEFVVKNRKNQEDAVIQSVNMRKNKSLNKAIDNFDKININKKRSLIFEAVLNPCDGYGASAEIIALAMAGLDFNFSYKPIRPSNLELLNKKTIELIKEGSGKSDNYLLYNIPLSGRTINKIGAKSKNKIMLTMFETTQVPSSWPKHINYYDKLVVPCNHNKEIFKNSGVNIPIEVIPLGVNTAMWPYKDRRDSLGKRPFRFLIYANMHWGNERKNSELVLEAFSRAFANRKDVELVIKMTAGGLPRDIRIPANVKILNAKYDHKSLLNLLHSCDCFVFPSKGEGYGLPPREAMATVMPCIVTNWSGME